ncbi:MAG: rhomboid family intramembrane serine protease [Bacteroidota bacterium]|nr:rhomboid family intramembrane serine protease [Bacteroidota bacterium]
MRNSSPKLFLSIFYPAVFIIVLWGVKLFEEAFSVNFSWYGLYPRTVHGLIGILTSPLLHADFSHLISNSLPLLVLGPIIFFFYRSIAFPVFFWVYLMTGIWVWAAGRESYHIGASGIIYGFVSFLFFSGVFRKDTRLLALSLFVTFLYGGTVWGMLPFNNGISWESHMLGALAGLITAYNFRKEGPQPKVYDLDDDEIEELEIPEEEFPVRHHPPRIKITYNYVPPEKEKEKES